MQLLCGFGHGAVLEIHLDLLSRILACEVLHQLLGILSVFLPELSPENILNLVNRVQDFLRHNLLYGLVKLRDGLVHISDVILQLLRGSRILRLLGLFRPVRNMKRPGLADVRDVPFLRRLNLKFKHEINRAEIGPPH